MIVTLALLPSSVVGALACAPLALQVSERTPRPPGRSCALSATVTGPRYQPAALAAGDTRAVVIGGLRSVLTLRSYVRSTPKCSKCSQISMKNGPLLVGV